jgi:cobalt-zinc-cadmium efflux system membrane fusion protein
MAIIVNRLTFPLTLLVAVLAACSEAPTPVPEAPQPIVQGNQLRFPANHPQLALLGLSTASSAKALPVELPAKLVWNEERTQRIFPAFAGRVASIKADVGQSVKPGTVLAQLASPDFGMAQADTAKAQTDAAFTQKALQRQRELFDAGIVARKDLEQAEADAARAQAEVTRAHARTSLYGASSGVNQQLQISASISGVVVERNLNPGQELRPDQSGPGVPAVFVVTDPTSLWVQIDARESEVATLKPGTVFELQVPALPGQKFAGRVMTASDFIDPATRTLKIRGLVANPERRLKAEMLATARVERVLPAGSVVIPAGAALLYGAKHRVFVRVQPGVFEPREVELVFEGPKTVVVARGLAVGDQVVIDNSLLLARLFRLAQVDAKTDNTEESKAVDRLDPAAQSAPKTAAPSYAPVGKAARK